MKSQLVAFVRGTEGQDLIDNGAVGGRYPLGLLRSRTERDVQHDCRSVGGGS